MEFHYSTASQDASRRFDYWREVVCRHCIPADSDSPHRAAFEARLSGRTVGPLTIASLAGPAHDWTRDAGYIRRGPESSLWLSYLEAGVGRLEQNGRSVVQNPGDLLLYDASRPFYYHITPQSFFIVRIPRELLLHRTGAAEQLVATPLGAGTGFRAVLGGLIKELSVNDAVGQAPSVEPRAISAVLDLLACMVDLHQGAAPSKSVSDALFERACGYIQQHLDDPELSVERVAQAQRVSSRTLARAFAAHGTTPTRHLWQKRLEASYCALAGGSVRKVSDAAMNCGFSDLSHFSRSFKRTFGVSPQALLWRRRSGAAPPDAAPSPAAVANRAAGAAAGAGDDNRAGA